MFEWLFWIIIGASAIIAFIAIQLLFSRLAEKEKERQNQKSKGKSEE